MTVDPALDGAAIDPELLPGTRVPSVTDLAAAFCGGFLGTLARYGFDLGWPEHLGGAAHTTNVINASGAFVAGAIVVILARRWPDRRALRAFVVTGFLGGWTTMSAIAVADARVGSASGVFAAALSAVAGIALGVAAAAGGARLVRRVTSMDGPS